MSELIRSEPILDLTHDEERDRHALERKVERAFYLAGMALAELRDRRLYRSTHSSFEEYCQDRFGYTRRRGDYLIGFSQVVDNLKQEPQKDSEPDRNREPLVLILPTSERQCRPLISLKPIEQRKVWKKAIELAGNKIPSGKIVSQAVSEFKNREPQAKSKYKIGTRIKIKSNHPLFGGSSGTIKQIPNQTGVVVALDKGETELISNEYIELELDSNIKKLPEEGITYTPGMALEYNARLSEETWERLNVYKVKEGAASLDGAISRLLDLVQC